MGEAIPDDCNILSCINSIYKKGNRKEYGSYSRIKITSFMCRMYGKILKVIIDLEMKNVEE